MNILFFGASSLAAQNLFNFFQKKKNIIFFGRRKIENVNFKFFDLEKNNKLLFSNLRLKKIDYIFFFSSYVPLDESKPNWSKCSVSNILGLVRILEDLKIPVKKIIFISSCSIYGNNKEINIKEEDQLFPLTDYSISKFSQEKILTTFCQINKIKYLFLRLGYVFGKNMNRKRIVRRVIDSKKENKKLNIYNKDLNLNLIHTKDISNVIQKGYKIIEGVYNLTYEHKTTLYDFYNKIYFNKKIKLKKNNFVNSKIKIKLKNFKFSNINKIIDEFKKI